MPILFSTMTALLFLALPSTTFSLPKDSKIKIYIPDRRIYVFEPEQEKVNIFPKIYYCTINLGFVALDTNEFKCGNPEAEGYKNKLHNLVHPFGEIFTDGIANEYADSILDKKLIPQIDKIVTRLINELKQIKQELKTELKEEISKELNYPEK